MVKAKSIKKALTNDICKRMDKMSLREVQALKKMADGLSTSNCWWFLYRIKPALQELAENEIQFRKFKKKK